MFFSILKSFTEIMLLILLYTFNFKVINKYIINFSRLSTFSSTLSIFSFFSVTPLEIFLSSILLPLFEEYVILFNCAYIASLDIPYWFAIFSIYTSFSISLSISAIILLTSFKNLILAFEFSRLNLFFNVFSLNYTN